MGFGRGIEGSLTPKVQTGGRPVRLALQPFRPRYDLHHAGLRRISSAANPVPVDHQPFARLLPV